jgi:hypothetical protein
MQNWMNEHNHKEQLSETLKTLICIVFLLRISEKSQEEVRMDTSESLLGIDFKTEKRMFDHDKRSVSDYSLQQKRGVLAIWINACSCQLKNPEGKSGKY